MSYVRRAFAKPVLSGDAFLDENNDNHQAFAIAGWNMGIGGPQEHLKAEDGVWAVIMFNEALRMGRQGAADDPIQVGSPLPLVRHPNLGRRFVAVAA